MDAEILEKLTDIHDSLMMVIVVVSSIAGGLFTAWVLRK